MKFVRNNEEEYIKDIFSKFVKNNEEGDSTKLSYPAIFISVTVDFEMAVTMTTGRGL